MKNNLFRKMLDVTCRMRMLKLINRECDRRDALLRGYRRKQRVIDKLVQEYRARFPDGGL